MLSTLLLAATSIASVAAQGIPATVSKLDLAVVKAQFDAGGYGAPIDNSTGINMTLAVDAGFGLNMMYGRTLIQNGQAYAASDVASMPTVYITTQNFETPATISTLMLVDLGALGNPDPQGAYLHYLSNNVHPASVQADANHTLIPTEGDVIVPYTAPNPTAGTGAHRYAWLLYGQRGSNFTAPAEWSQPNTAPGYINVRSYWKETKMKDLQAASFFTVENGAPTFAPITDTAINTATVVWSLPGGTFVTGGVGAAAAATGTTKANTSGSISRSSVTCAGVAGLAIAFVASCML